MSRQAPPNGVGFNVFPVAPAEYCGKGICAAPAGHEGTCDEASDWSENPEDYPCGAERFEPCRYGCLGYELDHAHEHAPTLGWRDDV